MNVEKLFDRSKNKDTENIPTGMHFYLKDYLEIEPGALDDQTRKKLNDIYK